MGDLVIDAFLFCRNSEFREGKMAIAAMPRLAKELSGGRDGSLHWSVKGGADAVGRPQLEIGVTGLVQLQCQRCMSAMPFDIASRSRLILATDEASAEELDQLLEKEDVEVIVGTHSMDLAEIFEDEALLALPLAPRHDSCPSGVARRDEGTAATDSPFAALKDLKS